MVYSCTPDANIRIPHTVKWSDITLPTDWTLVTESQPMPVQRSLNNLDYIRQYMDGSVKINFQHQPRSTVHLQQLPTPSPSKRYEPARHSSASSSTTVRDLEIEKDLIDLKIASLKKKDQVSHPCYGPPPVENNEPELKPNSPTQSDFLASEIATAHVYDIHNCLNVLKRDEPFRIDWYKLEKHTLDPINLPRRSNYHKAIPDRNKRNEIHQAWKDYMRTAKVEINYLDFVEMRYINNELKTITKEKWVKSDKSEVVLSHPPVETILITAGTKIITAAPFKIPDPNNELNKCLVEQNNYTNQSLVVIGKQLDKIETKVDKLIPSEPKLKSKEKPHNDEPDEFYKKKKYSPKKRWSKAPRYKKDARFKSGKSKDKSKVKCFKCQKYGHYANDCKVKDAIRQLKITDEEKDKLIKVLELRNSESSENETMLSHKLQTENHDIRQVLNALLEKEPIKENSPPSSPKYESGKEEHAVNLIKQVNFRKWYSKVTISVKDYEFHVVALFDSGADLNCIKEGLIPTKYYMKSTESLRTASGKSLQLNYEIPKAHKNIIRKSKSPWSCPAFYVQKNAELERGSPRLVINYKPLNSVLEWIRYPIPNKRDLIKRLDKAIHEHDRYKTAFVTPFGHYEWNVMPFGLKNAPSEFQNIMNEIFNTYSHFSIVYIDDVLIFSESIEQHWKHLHTFCMSSSLMD
ncbi:LRR and NB-ARC domains-containing disease resistance protein [Prunus dulcis]|uniref:LRR and NB-ARC domains-containing disease resistance protein n=1 Tax=Prunus dulcis TaxID=3755 RepID=A0A4Y1QMP7_PRUDU|nr:LRR and NB-ARC domains-containing disease resistance protein [Prunus dulcis]